MRVGTLLYGYCGGAFGRDSYNDKRVEAVGVDYVVAREVDSGTPVFCRCTPEELAEYTVKPKEEDDAWTPSGS